MAQVKAQNKGGFDGWLAEEIVATIESGTNEFRVSAVVSKAGRGKVTMREFYLHQGSGEMRPGRTGFSIDLETMDELVPALAVATEAVRGLLKSLKNG